MALRPFPHLPATYLQTLTSPACCHPLPHSLPPPARYHPLPPHTPPSPARCCLQVTPEIVRGETMMRRMVRMLSKDARAVDRAADAAESGSALAGSGAKTSAGTIHIVGAPPPASEAAFGNTSSPPTLKRDPTLAMTLEQRGHTAASATHAASAAGLTAAESAIIMAASSAGPDMVMPYTEVDAGNVPAHVPVQFLTTAFASVGAAAPGAGARAVLPRMQGSIKPPVREVPASLTPLVTEDLTQGAENANVITSYHSPPAASDMSFTGSGSGVPRIHSISTRTSPTVAVASPTLLLPASLGSLSGLHPSPPSATAPSQRTQRRSSSGTPGGSFKPSAPGSPSGAAAPYRRLSATGPSPSPAGSEHVKAMPDHSPTASRRLSDGAGEAQRRALAAAGIYGIGGPAHSSPLGRSPAGTPSTGASRSPKSTAKLP